MIKLLLQYKMAITLKKFKIFKSDKVNDFKPLKKAGYHIKVKTIVNILMHFILFKAFVITIATNALIYLFLNKISSDVSCNVCMINDKRHTIIKGLLIYTFVTTPILYIISILKHKITTYINKKTYYIMLLIHMVVNGALIFTFLLYFYDLKKSDCQCLTNQKNEKIYKFINVRIYSILVFYLASIVIPLIKFFTG